MIEIPSKLIETELKLEHKKRVEIKKKKLEAQAKLEMELNPDKKVKSILPKDDGFVHRAIYDKKVILSGHVLKVYDYEIAQKRFKGLSSAAIKLDYEKVQADMRYQMMLKNLEEKYKDYTPEQLNGILFEYLKKAKEVDASEIPVDNFLEKMFANLHQLSFDDYEKIELDRKKYLSDKKRQNRLRARNKVIDLINANPSLRTFMTFTFRNDSKKYNGIKELSELQDAEYCDDFIIHNSCLYDVKNVPVCNEFYKDAMDRIKNNIERGNLKLAPGETSFKYITVLEFQDGRGRGAVHYHMLCNLSFDFKARRDVEKVTRKIKDVEKQRAMERYFSENIWKGGFVNIQPLKATKKSLEKLESKSDDIDNVGAYVVKYMAKNLTHEQEDRLAGKQCYLRSSGLNEPVEGHISRYCDVDIDLSFELSLEKIKPTKETIYEGPYVGRVEYREYNFKRSGATELLEYFENILPLLK